MLEFERCFIMLCDNLTEKECLNRNLFGNKARKLQDLNEIKPGDIGFLLNLDRDELIGVFRSISEPKLNIEPDVWKGNFPAQIRVEVIGNIQKIKDASFVLDKSCVPMRQSVSGLPAPSYPVHGRDIGERILSYFKV